MGSGGTGAGGSSGGFGGLGGPGGWGAGTAPGGSYGIGASTSMYGGQGHGMGSAPETSANTNYYKAPPGYQVVFRKGEPVLVSTTKPTASQLAASTTTQRGTK